MYQSLEIFHPELYKAADTGRNPVFLNKELRVPGTRKGQRILDLLVDVPLLDGSTACVLLHCEVQAANGRENEPFNIRMFKYGCLIMLRLARPFTALAIRTTHRGAEEKLSYDEECFGSRQVYLYKTVFIDELNDEKLLSMKENPVALAVMAAKHMLNAQRSEQKRFEQGRTLLRILKERGYSVDDRMKVAMFVDGVMGLSSEKLMEEFEGELDKLLEEVNTMPVETPVMTRLFKRKSYEWGVADGEARGERLKALDTARKMLSRKMDIATIADLTELSEDDIQSLLS